MADWKTTLQKAASTKTWTARMCDNFVANMWGQSSSGYNTAVDNWNASPGKVQGGQAVTQIAPAGALYYWGGGAGHVALSAGDGTVFSTDIGGAGTVTRVPWNEISTKWNKPFLGWAPPFFNGASPGTVGPSKDTAGGKSAIDQVIGAAGSAVNTVVGGAENALGGLLSFPKEIIGFFSSATDDLTTVTTLFKAFFQPSTYVRMGAGMFGLIFLIVAAAFLIREASREAK